MYQIMSNMTAHFESYSAVMDASASCSQQFDSSSIKNTSAAADQQSVHVDVA